MVLCVVLFCVVLFYVLLCCVVLCCDAKCCCVVIGFLSTLLLFFLFLSRLTDMFRCVIYTIFRENLVLHAQNHLLFTKYVVYVTLVMYRMQKVIFVSIYVINSLHLWASVIVSFFKIIQQWASVTASTVVLRFASKALIYYRITKVV